jgi:hypothetical protein
MRFQRGLLIALLIFLVCSVISGQNKRTLFPITLSKDVTVLSSDCIRLGDIFLLIAEINVVKFRFSVRSNRKVNVEDLALKNIEVFAGKELLDSFFLHFDKSKNEYEIMVDLLDLAAFDRSQKLKIKLKLPEEKREQYGKVSVKMKNKNFDPKKMEEIYIKGLKKQFGVY